MKRALLALVPFALLTGCVVAHRPSQPISHYSPPPASYEAPPPVYQEPPPAYQAPPPAYQAPPPVYQAPPPVYQPPPVVYQPPRQPDLWYYGEHFIPDAVGGGWCYLDGPHTHDYYPDNDDHYLVEGGYYY